MQTSSRSAFSLVELGIVLAIIGLITGGVLAGKGMIRSSKINAAITEANKYADALHQFKDKYSYYPGDFPRATEVWGRADAGTPITSNCAAPTTTASTDGKTTCNGDGDGKIYPVIDHEHFRAWQHLSAAGMIQGRYTGISPSGLIVSVLNSNVPAGPLEGSGFFLWSWGIMDLDTSAAQLFAGNYNTAMALGGTVAGSWPSNPIFTGADAYNIDKKVDDGLPGLGNVRPADKTVTACDTTQVSSTSVYTRTGSSLACALIFLEGYRNQAQF